MSETLVIIESPFASNKSFTERIHVEYAINAMRDSFIRNEFPIASHLMYTKALDDSLSDERDLGIKAGLAWGKHASLTAVYVDFGISKGMQFGIVDALNKGRDIVFRSLHDASTESISAASILFSQMKDLSDDVQIAAYKWLRSYMSETGDDCYLSTLVQEWIQKPD